MVEKKGITESTVSHLRSTTTFRREEVISELIRRSRKGDEEARTLLSDMTCVKDTYFEVEGVSLD